jgi:WD40 repeat protein
VRELGYGGMLASVSEDTTCKLWKMPAKITSESFERVTENKSIETLKGHQGRNIRALACMDGIIATGGDDGAVKIWNAREILAKKAQSEEQSQANIT